MCTQVPSAEPVPARKAISSGGDNRALALAKADLARSGLTLDDAEREGVFVVDDASSINPDFAAKPALIFPYRRRDGSCASYNVSGKTLPFCRARYLTRPGLVASKNRKYDQPKGSGVSIYFPQSLNINAIESGELDSCVIVEGEKKAVALNAAGIPAIGLGGVDCFRQAKALHPDLEYVASKCREIYIVFDSDIDSNPRVQSAEWRLAGDLALRGVQVHAVRLPAGQDNVKVGADDFLVEHGAAALEKLILESPAIGARSEATSESAISVSELLKIDVKPVPELIPLWVQEGVPNFIAGPGGVHKSRLALQWGLCLNADANVWGYGGKRATLVYYSAEDDENELARRAQAISRRLNLGKSDSGFFIPRKGKDSALVVMRESGDVEVRPFYHEVVAFLKNIVSHKVVVLDSAYDFVRFAGRAKIDEDAVNYFIKVVLQGVCDETGSTLLIPWHPSQAGSGRGEMDGWSVAWHNAPRARLAISESRNVDGAFELKAVKRNHAPKGEPLTLKFDDGALLPLDAVDDSKKKLALKTACLKAANHAAEMDVPIRRQSNIPKSILKCIGQEAGCSVNSKQVKELLDKLCLSGDLIYQNAYGKLRAGYFPRSSGAVS